MMIPTDDEPAVSSRPYSPARPWDRAEYQRLWLHMQSRTWRTLAIVPAEDGMQTYDVASLLMTVGVHHGESIGVFDFRSITMNRVLHTIEAACSQVAEGERLIFAARSIKENLATIPLARASDAVVLCVSMGSTPIRQVEETIEQIGKERFLGSMLIRERWPKAPPSSRRALLARLEEHRG